MQYDPHDPPVPGGGISRRELKGFEAPEGILRIRVRISRRELKVRLDEGLTSGAEAANLAKRIGSRKGRPPAPSASTSISRLCRCEHRAGVAKPGQRRRVEGPVP